MYEVGVDHAEAATIAAELLGRRAARAGRLAVEVASTRARYGWLAAIYPMETVPSRRSSASSGAYGRLATAALDSAIALEDSLRLASTARVLLELSASLAEIATTDEMAAKVAGPSPTSSTATGRRRAGRPPTGTARIAAVHGYPHAAPPVAISLSRAGLRCSDTAVQLPARAERTTAAIGAGLRPIPAQLPSSTAPIVVGQRADRMGDRGGDRRSHRLTSPDVAERLRGLAGQAAIAISNARLLDQIRHQALHDS